MAFADLGTLGATGSTGNNQTQLDLVTTAAIAIGDLVVVVVAADNIVNSGDDNACSGVTLGVGGQALTKAKQVANALAAQAGASSSIWYGVATGALASGGTIRATFGSGTLVDASGMTARKFSKGASTTVAVEGTPGTLLHNTAADPGSLNVTTASIECLRVRSIAAQVGNNTNLTPTASWTAWANGNSATTGTTGEMCARAEHRIFTGTGAASDPTYVSAINANAYVAFREDVAPATGTGDLDAGSSDLDSTGDSSSTSTAGALNAQSATVVTSTPGVSGSTGVGVLPALVDDDEPTLDLNFAEDTITEQAATSYFFTLSGVGEVASITSGAGSAVGTSTAAAIGEQVGAAAAAAAGTGSSSVVGAQVAAAAAAASAIGASSVVGSTVVGAVANAPAAGAATGEGESFDFLEPDGDVALDGWTDQASGVVNIFQAIDEIVTNDADYVQSPAVTGTNTDFKVRLYKNAVQIVEWTHINISATFTEVEQTLSGAEVTAIGDFEDLFIEFDDNVGNVYRFALADATEVDEPVTVTYRYRKQTAA